MNKIALILEDSPEDQEHLANLLSQIDEFDIYAFSDGNEAVEFARTRSADYILLDHRLENNFGIVFLGSLKALCPRARVVLITGYATDSIGASKSDGFDAILSKDSLEPGALKAALFL